MIDALDYLLHERESLAGGVEIGGRHLLELLGTHVLVTVQAILVAAAIALPPALWLGHRGRGQLAASTAANLGRAVPSFAVLVFFSAYFGANVTNLVFAMVLLALPPIFTNAYVGVRQVDREVVDAARGMGLTERQLVTRVELPLALPLVLGGVRTSTVNVIATATLGPYVGVDTLGIPIINVNVHGEAGRLGGAILVALLAIAAELAFAALQRAATPRGIRSTRNFDTGKLMKTRRILASALAALALGGLAACGGDDDENTGNGTAAPVTTAATAPAAAEPIERNADNASKPPVVIGSKDFTEAFILGEIYAQALEAAGYRVRKQLNLGSEQIALRAVRSGRVDAYPEYTGTALTSFFGVKIDDVPKDSREAYEQARDGFAKRDLVALAPTPFTNSQGFAMTSEGAKKAGGVRKLSDLAGKAERMVLSGPPECAQRTDCKLGLERVYGLRFQRFLSIAVAKRHEVIKSGQSDVGLVFTTDGQIKAENLVLLEDDRRLLPPYNISLVVRRSTLRRAGDDFQRVVEQVQKGLTTEVMQELNSRVDLDKQSPEEVAAAYLREAGYVTG